MPMIRSAIVTDNAVVDIAADRLYAGDIVHGEGPVDLGDRIAVLDMLAGRIVLLDLDGELLEVVQMPDPVAALVRPRRGGGMVVVLEHDIHLLGPDGAVEQVHHIVDDARVRFNEGTVAPDGSLLCGTMAYDQLEPLGAIYRFDGERSQVVRKGVTIANGLQFRTDGVGRFIDSTRYELESVRFDEQGIASTGVVATFDRQGGMPDGLALDEAGGTWVALFGGGCVVRFDEDGRVTHRVTLPTPDVTSCAFAGPDRRRLIITTSALLTGSSDAAAGVVYVADAPFSGSAMPPCAF